MQPRAEWLSPTIHQLARRLGQRGRPLLLSQPLPSHADLLLTRPGAGSCAAEGSVDPPWEGLTTNSFKQSLALPRPSSDLVLLRTPFGGATTSSSLGLLKRSIGSPSTTCTAEAAGPHCPGPLPSPLFSARCRTSCPHCC